MSTNMFSRVIELLKPNLFEKPAPMWTLDEGLALVRQLQPLTRAFNCHLAIGGGVVNAGQSEKDLDLYFLPLDGTQDEPRTDGLVALLRGLWGEPEVLTVARYGGAGGAGADGSRYEHKLKFMLGERRIDVFVAHSKGR